MEHKHLEYNCYLSKLVEWIYFNSLLIEQSDIYICNGCSSQCYENKLH
ncbi:MAG: hypothetical protein ACTS7E_04905 [Arsenophonus sp. NC-CH8-MAG3]